MYRNKALTIISGVLIFIFAFTVGRVLPIHFSSQLGLISNPASENYYRDDFNDPGATDGIASLNNVTVSRGVVRPDTVPAPVLPSGAIGFWHLDGNFADVVGGVSAEVSGSVSFVGPGRLIQAASFSGAGRIEVANTSNFNLQSFTLAAWIKAGQTDTDGSEIISRGDSYGLRLQPDGNPRLFFYDGANWPKLVTTNQNLKDDQWHHVVGVKNGNVLQIFIDGQLAAQSSVGGSVSFSQGPALVIGAHGAGEATEDFYGLIDEVGIWGRALTTTEIATLFNVPNTATASFVSTPILFNGAAGTIDSITSDLIADRPSNVALEIGPDGSRWCPIANQSTVSVTSCGITGSQFYYRVTFLTARGDAAVDDVSFRWVTLASPSIPAGSGSPAALRTIYVDQDNKFGHGCNNNWPGTTDQPKCNFDGDWFQKNLEPGDEVVVRQASSYGEIRFYTSSSGAPDHPVVVKAYPGEKINLVSSLQNGIRHFGPLSYVTIEGPIEIANREYSVALGGDWSTVVPVDHVRIRNCRIYNADHGPRLFDVSNGEISNCQIGPLRVNGIQLRRSSNILLKDIDVHDVSDNRAPENSDADGVHTYGGDGITFINVSSSRNAEDGFDLNANAVLINSRSFNNNAGGVKVWRRQEDGYAAKTVTLINSLVYDNGYYPPNPSDGNPNIKVSDGAGLNVYNSVISKGYEQGILIQRPDTPGYAVQQLPVSIYNTIITNTMAGPGLDDWSSPSVITANNNLYYNNPRGNLGGNAREGDSSLFYFNPQFVDLPGGDFHLLASSPAINRGADLRNQGVIRDMDGVIRPQGSAFDIGAYEYEYGGSTPLPVADTTPPAVSITSPAGGATISNTIAIGASASDNVGVTGIDFYLDGAPIATDATSPFSVNWNTTDSANGAHTITATAYDAADNQASRTIMVTVNNQAVAPLFINTYSVVPRDATAGIHWTTNVPATGAIYYGTSASSLNQVMATPNLAASQGVILTNLRPRTRYYYQIVASAGTANDRTAIHQFRTKRTSLP